MDRSRPLLPDGPSSDEELLDDFRGGDKNAFGELAARYQKELFGYLRKYLRNENLAEDVSQNTFLQLFRKAHRYESGRPVRPWLYTIATRQAIDALRRIGRHPTLSLMQAQEGMFSDSGEPVTFQDMLEDPGPSPVQVAEAKEVAAQLAAAIDELPNFQRVVIKLAYYEGLKYREIAEKLGIKIGTVKSRLHSAIAVLKEKRPDLVMHVAHLKPAPAHGSKKDADYVPLNA